MAKCGFPLKINDLINTVQSIIKEDKRVTPFALRESEGISKRRAIITNEFITKWFAVLKEHF